MTWKPLTDGASLKDGGVWYQPIDDTTVAVVEIENLFLEGGMDIEYKYSGKVSKLFTNSAEYWRMSDLLESSRLADETHQQEYIYSEMYQAGLREVIHRSADKNVRRLFLDLKEIGDAIK